MELDLLNKIILSLGANNNSEINIAAADDLLRSNFVSIHFSEPVYTEPIGDIKTGLFLNQVAIAYTSNYPDEINKILKQVERALGRTPESKEQGIIPIDIDLLQWNEQVLKPDDLQRDYVRSLLRTLSIF